jgi:hypothetical protein
MSNSLKNQYKEDTMELLLIKINLLYTKLKEEANGLFVILDVKEALLAEIEKCHIAAQILFLDNDKEELNKMYEYMGHLMIEIEQRAHELMQLILRGSMSDSTHQSDKVTISSNYTA